MAEHQWIFVETGDVGGTPTGPVDQGELIRLIRNGRLTPQSLVSSPTQSGGKWYRISQVPALTRLCQAEATSPNGSPAVNSSARIDTLTRDGRFEIFLSYSRIDNRFIGADANPRLKGWVTALRDHILADHRRFSTEPLRIFFDQDDIRDMDDWRHRILGGLQSSKILLVCLSPNYFASEYCRWEFDEYVRRQVHQLMGSESIAAVYFVEVPGSDEHDTARRLAELTRGNYTDIRPWFPAGVRALQETEVQRRMAALGNSLWERLQRARRAEAVAGNLRWQNPHFVGRREELRKLHEQLGTGSIGVVTAVQGLGGQGKTELAVAYAHGWADCYPAGLWSLGAEGKTELLPLIGELAWERSLGFTPSDAEKNDAALLGRGVLAHLKARAEGVQNRDPDQGAAALILLDNVSEPELLSAAQLATLPGGLSAGWLRIVATTRLDLREQKNRLALLTVDALDEESALSLIRDHQPPRSVSGTALAAGSSTSQPDSKEPAASALPLTGSDSQPQFASDAEESAAWEIVRALGGFTLAIEQVALYLGLHPEVSPTSFLATLRERGLPLADTIPGRDPDVAARMLTQSKQLGLILDATLAKLDAPALTALQFAALLPPDTVAWPWLRELTLRRHPELAARDELGGDPWLAVRRRLSGLRLLTSGDQPEIARIHRLVAAHLVSRGRLELEQKATKGTKEGASGLGAEVLEFVAQRAWSIYESQSAPNPWELDALLTTLPMLASTAAPSEELRAFVSGMMGVSDKLVAYRSLTAAEALLIESRATLQRLAESDPANAAWQRDLSVSFNKLGDLATAQGNLPEAQRLFGEALRIAQRLAESDPANAAWQRDLFVSFVKLGDLATAQGNLPEAQRLFGEQLRIAQRLAESDPANAAWQRDLSVSFNKLGDLATAQGNLPEAQRLFGESLRIAQRLAESDPANAAWQRDLSVSFDRLGELATAQGNLPEAQRLFGESLRIAQRLAESDPANAAWQRDLSVSCNKLGELATAQGNLPEAQRLFGESLRIAQRLAESDPANAAWQRDLSVSFNKLGDLATAQGNLPEAQRLFGESLRIAQRLAESDPANAEWQRDLSVSFSKLGDLATAQGNLPEAQRLFGESLRIAQRLAESDPANAEWQRDLSVSFNKLGDLATAQGNLPEAQRLFGESLRIAQRLAESDPANAEWQRDLSVSFNKLGDLATAQGNLPEAQRLFGESLRIAQRLAESDPANAAWQRDLSVSFNKLGDLATAQGNLPEAQRLFGESLRIRQRLAESDPANAAWQRDLAVSHYKLAMFAQQSGDETGFIAELRERFGVLDRMKQRGQHFDPQIAQLYEQLATAFGQAPN